MSLLPFLAIAFAAGALSLLTRRAGQASAAIGLVGLGLAAISAAVIRTEAPFPIGGLSLAGTDYARLFLLLGSLAGLLSGLVALAMSWSPSLPGAVLVGLGAAGLTLGVDDPGTAIAAATGGGLVGLLVSASGSTDERGLVIAARELRAVVIAGVLGLLAASAVSEPFVAARLVPSVLGLVYLAFAAAVAIRLGSIPFHLWAARVAVAVPEIGLPLVMAWGPAALLVVALAWTDASIAPLGRPLDLERGLIIAVAAASMILGATAAFVHDDLEHVVGYSIVSDGGVALLGLAALDPAAWEPTRVWLLVFVVARTAFATWAAAVRATFGTRRLSELRGWIRGAPTLGLGLAAIALATIGIPGMAAFAARSRLIELNLIGLPAAALLGGALLPILYYGRILAVGLARPSPAVAAGPDPRPSWPPGRHARLSLELVEDALEAWRINRAPIGAATVLVMAALGLALAGGGLGVQGAAAALPPGVEGNGPSTQPSPTERPAPIQSPAA